MKKVFSSIFIAFLLFSQTNSMQPVFNFPIDELLEEFLEEDQSEIVGIKESYISGGLFDIDEYVYFSDELWREIFDKARFEEGVEILEEEIVKELGIISCVPCFTIDGREYSYDRYLYKHKAYLYCLKAVKNKDIVLLLTVIPYATNINFRFICGDTLLHYAVRYNFLLGLDLLIRMNSFTDSRDKHGVTPIMLAVENKNFGALELLLRKGANINIKSFGVTPLHRAVLKRDVDLVRILLNEGALIVPANFDRMGFCSEYEIAPKLFCIMMSREIIIEDDMIKIEESMVHLHDDKTPLDLAREKNYDEITKVLADELGIT